MKLNRYLINNLLWNQRFYLKLEEEVHPFNQLHLFRPLSKAYNGSITFWSTPSPEPNLSDAFWLEVEAAFRHQVKSSDKSESKIYMAARKLAASILIWQPNPEKILFVSILRAGVPITEWLCQMLPGSVGAALSLFVGIGIDKVALSAIERDFPDRTIIFVDGWTGKGGVAREIAKLNKGPLAVLIDPWGWADFAGTREDIFCPSACFTGLATLGFSRTFFLDNDNFFSAYRFSEDFAQPKIVKSWKMLCSKPLSSSEISNIIQSETDIDKFFSATTDLRIHSNEVCRALINAAPEILFFADDQQFVEKHFSLLLKLAKQRAIPAEFNVCHLNELKTKVACRLSTVL
ncbi:MAG: hypothetical protein HQK70_06515 [Desulfamplus sp.]|nr:hypothetical protein [Desulfamplus sp.]